MSTLSWLLLALAFALAFLAGCGRNDPAPPGESAPATAPGGHGDAANTVPTVTLPAGSPQLAQIRVGSVEAREIPFEEVVAPGRVGIDPNRTSRLLLPAPGRIAAVHVKLGDTVEQGQPVVALTSPDADGAVATYAQAQAAERQAHATLGKAETDHARARDLHEHGAVAQKDLESVANDLAQAQAALESARAATLQARRRLDLLGLRAGDQRPLVEVRAPLTGKVLEISVAPGEYRSDTSTPLMTIADLSRVWITSDVPEPAIRLIHTGDQVAITMLAFPGEVFTGRVTRIGDVLDRDTRTVKVHVEMANPSGRFRPEMFATLHHEGASRRVPVIPVAALVQDAGRALVFVERSPGVFERRPITPGARRADLLPVLDGLQSSERIVVDGAVLLKDR